jgi:predicted transcriptional regulator YheO
METETPKQPDGKPEEHGAILAHYVNMAQVLGDMFSPILETVVHDLRKPESSIIAIYNGSLTGREVGDSATNLGRRLMKGDFPDVVVGYENESPNGQKMKSSSLAIRDESGDLIGVMGLNLDISYFDQFSKFIEQFISRNGSDYVSTPERFQRAPGGATPEEEIEDEINEYITSKNWNTRTLSYDDKREIVEHLYKNGLFKIRGAVTIISNKLGLTRPSVYNYKNDYIEQMQEEQE